MSSPFLFNLIKIKGIESKQNFRCKLISKVLFLRLFIAPVAQTDRAQVS